MTSSYSVAWVPDDEPQRDYDEAAALGVEWVLEQAASSGDRPILVTHAFGIESDVPSLRRLLNYSDHVTPRSRRSTSNKGPILAYVPYEDTIELAVRLARRSALCVVETTSFPVGSWARAVEALDLTRGRPTQPFPPEIAQELERVIFYGNNGWTRGFGSDRTRQVLTDLYRSGFDDVAALVSYAGARGKSKDAMKRLRDIALKVGFSQASTS